MNNNKPDEKIHIGKEKSCLGNFGVIMEKRYLNIKECAEYTGFSTKTLYKWSRSEIIPCCKIGRALRFDKLETDKWIKNYNKGSKNADLFK